MAKNFPQLEEHAPNRSPDIWVVCGSIEGDRVNFEMAYLNSSYGGSEAILVPVGSDSPRIRIEIPQVLINRPATTILVKPSYFTILGITD